MSDGLESWSLWSAAQMRFSFIRAIRAWKAIKFIYLICGFLVIFIFGSKNNFVSLHKENWILCFRIQDISPEAIQIKNSNLRNTNWNMSPEPKHRVLRWSSKVLLRFMVDSWHSGYFIENLWIKRKIYLLIDELLN